MGVRLGFADDRRVRVGLKRGDEVKGDLDPFAKEVNRERFESTRESRERRMNSGVGNERNVLSKTAVEEGVMRALVDPESEFAAGAEEGSDGGAGQGKKWPPSGFGGYNKAMQALGAYVVFDEVMGQRRERPLKEVWLFETELVDALRRQQDVVDLEYALMGDGTSVTDGEAWKRVLRGCQGWIDSS